MNIPSMMRYVPTRRNEQARVVITSLCNDCFEEPLAPTAARPAVTSSEGDLGHLEVAYTHSRLVPSSAAQHKGLVEAVQGRVDEHMCSVALDGFGGDECAIVAAIRSWSSGAAHQTSVREGSSKGEQVQGSVHLASEGTGVEQRDCSLRKHYWGEGSPAESHQNHVCDVCWPYPNPPVPRPRPFDHQDRWRDRR